MDSNNYYYPYCSCTYAALANLQLHQYYRSYYQYYYEQPYYYQPVYRPIYQWGISPVYYQPGSHRIVDKFGKDYSADADEIETNGLEEQGDIEEVLYKLPNRTQSHSFVDDTFSRPVTPASPEMILSTESSIIDGFEPLREERPNRDIDFANFDSDSDNDPSAWVEASLFSPKRESTRSNMESLGKLSITDNCGSQLWDKSWFNDFENAVVFQEKHKMIFEQPHNLSATCSTLGPPKCHENKEHLQLNIDGFDIYRYKSFKQT